MGKGFILDDWDIGFQSDIKLHRTPTADDIQDGYEEDELIDDYDLPAHWLMMQMNNKRGIRGGKSADRTL